MGNELLLPEIHERRNAMCCGTAKSPCIEVELHPAVAENCCGTAKSPCIEVEVHPDVKENSKKEDDEE